MIAQAKIGDAMISSDCASHSEIDHFDQRSLHIIVLLGNG
ncbi:predicted protein [Plenodomus lingam JN3]|uniref:Predicted protein n=1 Tax=Leptosphaeria maculans (strain JN3 / isolate v23.1.3 / race Av1-4-5-6-7-8) TaxID=985895 RepID=E5A018_LEPMJ|nr:predicted protein [Plenodomus lingam JN3]CBX96878.1 predicted protein [Plenodomus lingam JN3]